MRILLAALLALALVAVAGARAQQPSIFTNGFDPPIPVGCPASIETPQGTLTRITTTQLRYSAQGATKPVVWLTEWDNVWGHGTVDPREPVTPWPGVGGSAPVFLSFKRGNYVGIHFRTPDVVDPRLASKFVNPTAIASPNVTFAISRACGDFAKYLPTPGCLRKDVPSADTDFVIWQFAGTSPATACNLKPATDYYVNMMLTDRNSTLECSAGPAGVCQIAAWRQ